MKIRIRGSNIGHYDVYGAEIVLYSWFGKNPPDDGGKRGVFTVTSVTKSNDIFAISASDNICWLVGKMNFGIFKDNSNKCLGTAVFGRMMNLKSFKSISDDLEENEIVELNRLWIDDYLGHNAESVFIGAYFKIFRSFYPEIKAVQSFADGRLFWCS